MVRITVTAPLPPGHTIRIIPSDEGEEWESAANADLRIGDMVFNRSDQRKRRMITTRMTLNELASGRFRFVNEPRVWYEAHPHGFTTLYREVDPPYSPFGRQNSQAKVEASWEPQRLIEVVDFEDVVE